MGGHRPAWEIVIIEMLVRKEQRGNWIANIYKV